jgi:uncharacterized repeat protein (TIGR01451 family)
MVGNALTYTLIVTNSGPLTATGVILTSTLPAGVNVISRATTQGSCGQANLIITCTLGAINVNANAVVTVIVTPTVAAVGVITHQATVLGNEPDPAPSNNSVTQNTTVNPLTADLRLSMSDKPDPVIERSPLTYTLVITNVGPATATGIKITDTLPASVNFITATTSQGTCARTGNIVVCAMSPVAKDAQATVTLVVTPTHVAVGVILNQASVKSNEFDPNEADNTVAQNTVVLPYQADLQTVMLLSTNPVAVGERLTYTVNILNNGPITATNVRFTNTLPSGVFTASLTTSQGACASTGSLYVGITVTCGLGALNSNANATVTVVVTPTVLISVTPPNLNAGIITATAIATANEPDPLTINNSVTRTAMVNLPRLNSPVRTVGCYLTEYYDAPATFGGSFRIYYTRSYPNQPSDAQEQDCRLVASGVTPQTPAPLPPLTYQPNGYPAFVVELGDSAEVSYNRFAQLGYTVNRLQRTNGRFPIHVVNAAGGGVAFPEQIEIGRFGYYSPTASIDVVRVTMAHELFHAVQFTYVPGGCYTLNRLIYCVRFYDMVAWQEAASVWVQPKVYPNGGKYSEELDELFNTPYIRLLDQSGNREYKSMMFANFLEQVVAQAREPANAEAIIRRTWERYEANGGGSMLTAIDQVLQGAPYNTSLAAEFPEYARHNYFLNGDAYTRDAHVYINDTQNANDLFETIQIPQQNPQQAKEWQLFRSRLRGMAGLDYVGGQSQGTAQQNAAVGTFPVRGNQYPSIGPTTPDYANTVQRWSAGYIEFYSPRPAVAGTILSVTIEITAAAPPVGYGTAQLSIIPIRDFGIRPNPPNTFLQGESFPSLLSIVTRYAVRVTNFDQCQRATLIINGLDMSINGSLTHGYRAELTTIQPPANPPANMRVLACPP